MDLERQSHIDRDSSSKSKKKHKKHKKHKKSKKHDGDEKAKDKEKEKSSSKKHKKHHRRSNDEYTVDFNNDLNSSKCKLSATTTVTSTSTKLETNSTLNSKFTEIMKSNGHVVIAKAPITKFSSASNGANDESKANNSSKIPTDPNKLVEFIAKSLDSNTSTQIVSSASETDSMHDADSPDVAVIEEDDLNLEELTRQKALLLARLGGIAMSEDEGDKSNTPKVSNTPGMKSKSANNYKPIDKSKLKRPSNETVNDVILLDDSSNDVPDKRSPPRKKQRGCSRSRSRDRSNKLDTSRDRSNNRDSRDNRDNRKASKSHRNDNDNRYKEDLRKEIDRDKEKNRSSPKPTHKQHSTTADQNLKSKFNSNKVKQSASTFMVREREVGKKTFVTN